MRKLSEQENDAKKSALKVFLLSLLIVIPATIYLVFFAVDKDSNVNNYGHIAHGFAVVLAFISAFVFMGIMFFSSRSGHDEQPNYREIIERKRALDAEAKKTPPSDDH